MPAIIGNPVTVEFSTSELILMRAALVDMWANPSNKVAHSTRRTLDRLYARLVEAEREAEKSQ